MAENIMLMTKCGCFRGRTATDTRKTQCLPTLCVHVEPGRTKVVQRLAPISELWNTASPNCWGPNPINSQRVRSLTISLKKKLGSEGWADRIISQTWCTYANVRDRAVYERMKSRGTYGYILSLMHKIKHTHTNDYSSRVGRRSPPHRTHRL